MLRLPRNLYLTLRKCCACHAIQSLRNLRAAVPMGPSPRPFRDRSETVPRPPPYRRRSRGGLRTVRKHNSRTAPTFSASCHPQLAESACESAAPATKSILEKAIYVLSWLYVKAIYLSCKPIGKLSICQASYMSKLSICHASLLESYLSVKLAICQSYLFVMQAYWKAIYLSS